MKKRNPKALLARIAEAVTWRRVLHNGRPDKNSTPGEVIKRLSSEERESLTQLKSEDIKDDMLRHQH